MIQKNVPLLILSGLIAGIVLAFVAMSALPLQTAGAGSTVLPVQPVVQQKITPGAEVLPRFSTAEEARAFVRSHLENSDTPRLLTTENGLAGSQTTTLPTRNPDLGVYD